MGSPASLSSAFSCHLLPRSALPTTTKPYPFTFPPGRLFIRTLCRLSISAAIKQRKGDKMSTSYVDEELGGDYIDDAFEVFDEEEEEEDGKEDGESLSFDKMRRWLKSKPLGFGEGKSYDTSLEDRLLNEIEQSRIAQEANVQKLKLNPSKSAPPKQTSKNLQKEQPKDRGDITVSLGVPTKNRTPFGVKGALRRCHELLLGFEDFPGGVRIRMSKLPKKKNIHKDLLSVFNGFPGLLRVSPAVTGNKKTKDPICKGFAFLDFESEETAHRFVEMHSGQSIPFGKIQKQISFDTLKLKDTLKSGFQSSEKRSRFSPQLKVIDVDAEFDASIGIGILEPEQHSVQIEDSEPVKELTNTFSCDDNLAVRGQYNPESSNGNIKEKPVSPGVAPSKKHKKTQVRKIETERKPDNGLKSRKVPGSVARLKIRERAVLTEIFSKYGATVPSPEPR